MKDFSKLGLIAVIIVYMIVAFAISHVTPFNQGPDEGSNLSYISFIIANGRLPITYDEREQVGADGNQPALYHLMVSNLSNVLGVEVTSPPYIKIFWDSFRYRTLDIEGESAWYLLTEDQNWPFKGKILALHLGRWLSIVISISTLLLVYLIVLELLPSQKWLALSAVAILAFIPMFIFMNSVLNEDALVAATTALYLLALIKAIKQPDRWRWYLVMGLAMGVSVTVKYTTAILPLESILVLTVLAWHKDYGWRWLISRVAVVGVCAVVVSSWWFGWSIWYLNTVDENGWPGGLVEPFARGGSDITLARLGHFFSGGQIGVSGIPEERSLGSFQGWLWYSFRSFWGVSAGGMIPGFFYAFGIIFLVMVVTTFGLSRLWRREPNARIWLGLMVFHIGIFFVFPLLRFTLSRRLGETAQGRHILIPAAAAIVGLIVWGLSAAIPKKWQRWVFPAIVTIFFVWTVMHVPHLATSWAPLLPFRTLPEAAEWLSTPVNVQFGEDVELVSYELSVEPERGRMDLALAWRSLDHVNENYLLNVELMNVKGAVVSQWVGYNGQGRVPTLAWDPGDSVFDRLSLPLPNLPPGDYRVQVQLLGQNGPVSIDSASDQQDAYALTQISLDKSSSFLFPHRLEMDGTDIAGEIPFAIWRSDGPVRPAEMPHYRYPATVSIVVSNDLDPTGQTVQLVDPNGRAWPADRAAANVFAFVVGPRWQSGDYRLQITSKEGQKFVSESLLSVENWWERQFDVPEIEVPLEANFADQLYLLGYNLPQGQIKAGEAFPITLYWQARPDRSPQANFIQFNHLLDSAGALRGGYDRRPLEYYSTLLWAPGEVVVDGYAVPVDVDAPAGEYYLNVGYYLTVGESAVNLPLVVDGAMTDVTSVTIGPIEVEAP